MPRGGREGPGTGVRRALDTKKLAEALTMPGIDPRLWCSYGTVGTVDDGGKLNHTDWTAIYVGPEGVEVDVMLEPLELSVTCHYYGVMGGRAATIQSPIRPGDQVLVHLPGGDPTQMPVIAAVLHGEHSPVPIGPDRLPVWKNDSIFVWAEDVPVDIRTKGGGRVRLDQAGKVDTEGSAARLGADAATEALMRGTTYRANEATLDGAWQTLLTALNAYAVAIQAIADPGNVATPILTAALTAMQAALSSFEGAAAQYLSTYAKTK